MTTSSGSNCQEQTILTASILVVNMQIPKRENFVWLSLVMCSYLGQERAGHSTESPTKNVNCSSHYGEQYGGSFKN